MCLSKSPFILFILCALNAPICLYFSSFLYFTLNKCRKDIQQNIFITNTLTESHVLFLDWIHIHCCSNWQKFNIFCGSYVCQCSAIGILLISGSPLILSSNYHFLLRSYFKLNTFILVNRSICSHLLHQLVQLRCQAPTNAATDDVTLTAIESFISCGLHWLIIHLVFECKFRTFTQLALTSMTSLPVTAHETILLVLCPSSSHFLRTRVWLDWFLRDDAFVVHIIYFLL